jgi:hypothetical protein
MALVSNIEGTSMRGTDFESLDDFAEACLHKRDTELDASCVLGKVYSIEQLREIAKVYEFEEETEGEGKHGISQRYEFAQGIAEAQTAQDIGELLSRIDHDFYFPILTYFRFPHSELFSATSHDPLLKRLEREGFPVSSDFAIFCNSMIKPKGRSCELESVKIHHSERVISFLLSCTRILTIPEGRQADFRDFFLARIPVVMRLLFDHQLIEISLPVFAEPVRIYPNMPFSVPARYQAVIESAQAWLANTLSAPPRTINFGQVALYLESELHAIDMGWRIAPQSEAEFDLRQGAIPLRTILESFSESLKNICRIRKLSHPISEIDLYKVFRALKEQSYTYSLVLRVPLGSRGGDVYLTTLYGNQNSGYVPIILLSRNNKNIGVNLYKAINQSQLVTLMNPYNLDALLKA